MVKIHSFVFLSCIIVAGCALADDFAYEHGADSKVKEGVPRGELAQHEWLDSTVFEGTKRRYSVYVPAQYNAKSPAALMVFQDGHAYESLDGDFRVPTVFDNLIHQGAMPPTIAVFIDPGTHKDMPKKRGWKPTPSIRSFEYDTLSSDYSTFLIDEILAKVTQQYQITANPKLRAIGGISSGGICAFTVAWERPDVFTKVLSHVGSFVNIRGGHDYAAIIRKTEPKPIRVFLQDGSGDLDNQHGNWPLANQQMAKSLAFKEYDFKFVYGEGGHNGKHGGAILPESLRWLWRDWKNETP